jgi:hypothetical protein
LELKKIDDYAFADNKLISITPHPNMEIGFKSFDGNPLSSPLVPAGITLVKPNADEGTNPWTDHFTDKTNVPAVYEIRNFAGNTYVGTYPARANSLSCNELALLVR